MIRGWLQGCELEEAGKGYGLVAWGAEVLCKKDIHFCILLEKLTAHGLGQVHSLLGKKNSCVAGPRQLW